MNIQEDALKTALKLLRENPETAKALGVNIKLVTDEVLPEHNARILSELQKIAPIAQAISEAGVDRFKSFSKDRQLETVNVVRIQQNLIAERGQKAEKIFPKHRNEASRKGRVFDPNDINPDEAIRDFGEAERESWNRR